MLNIKIEGLEQAITEAVAQAIEARLPVLEQPHESDSQLVLLIWKAWITRQEDFGLGLRQRRMHCSRRRRPTITPSVQWSEMPSGSSTI